MLFFCRRFFVLPWASLFIFTVDILTSNEAFELPTTTIQSAATVPNNNHNLPAKVEVAIAGGGLGGLAVCIALRNRGVDAHVFEASPVLLRGSTGTGIMISPNGFSALDAIDPSLNSKMRHLGAQIRKQSIRMTDHDTGKVTRSVDIGGFAESYGIDQYNIGWARAHETLASSLPEEVVHCGCKLDSYQSSQLGETGEECVSLSLEDGRTVQASLLIGADGFGSKVRKLLAGDKMCRTRFNGQLLWNAIVPTDKFPKPVHKKGEVEFITCGADGQAILAFDAGEGKTAWYMTMMEESAPSEIIKAVNDGVFGGFGGQWGAKTALKEEFKKWPLALECLEATPDDQIFERRQAYRSKLMKWSSRRKSKGARGRVVLMGDAAHPMIPSLGQGTMLTWEDAAELAASLVPSGTRESFDTSKIPSMVRKFVRRRAKRCAMVQKLSYDRRMGRPLPKFFPLKLFTMLRMQKRTREMYSHKSSSVSER